MSAYLKDHVVLTQLDSAYGLNRFLFINQLDVKMDLTNPETAFLDPRRVVAIHYTILDKNGKQLSGGLASQQFPGTESDMNHIIGGNLYKLSAEVMNSLMVTEQRIEKEAEKLENRKSNTKPSKSGKNN